MADKEPQRRGWFYKTAAQLLDELGLTRRGYEKARKFLSGKGVIQCRRAGVHGRMHWQLNKERLLELCYLVKGEPLPKFHSRYHLDIDNFRLEKWVNFDLWNEFLKMRAEKGKPLNIKQKKILLNQLKDLKNKNYDLNAVMQKSILNGWAGFYASDHSPNIPAPPTSEAATRKAKAEYEAQIKQSSHPPPDTGGQRNPDNLDRQNLKNLKNLFRKKQ
ncbi:hypothetical protein [Neisseria sicca]|uniref:hypothetical protein n=1 Tax=Neisseria sicca TaxID=490 RepID=UPI0002EF89C5|nr:hypothetical protein [Neisseria sicca]